MTDPRVVVYAHLPEGGFIAAASHRPDVYLTWLEPGTTCSLNVQAMYAVNDWVPMTIGRHLSWEAFTTQAETILGAEPTHHTHRACELIYARDLSAARCSCGHWRRTLGAPSGTVPRNLGATLEAFKAHATAELAFT